jgi:hypothetical protein
MIDSNTNHLPGAPLPNSVVELQARRLTPFKRLLNDMVEELHTKCYEDEKYRAYLEGVWDEQCVEGSLAADNFKAAEMIRARATKENSPVAREKLATLVKSLGIVLRRYGLSRKERRQTVGGEVVPNSDE